VLALPGLPDNSIGLSVSSMAIFRSVRIQPFYQRLRQLRLDQEISSPKWPTSFPRCLRVTIPGRFAIVHVKDRIIYGSRNNGYRKMHRFSDHCADATRRTALTVLRPHHHRHRPGARKCPNEQSALLELKKDASRYGVGMPEYLLLFRKPHTTTAEGGQWSDARIDSITDENYGLPRWQLDANSFWRSSGERQLMPWEQGGYSYAAHVAYLGRPRPQDPVRPRAWPAAAGRFGLGLVGYPAHQGAERQGGQRVRG
jgi:hypothetical protein